MATVRPGIMEALEPDASRSGEIIRVEPAFLRADLVTRIVETVRGDKDKVEFHKARGDRFGRPAAPVVRKGFKLLRKLAAVLNAELGGTRVAVESGWIPYERQIGQTVERFGLTVYCLWYFRSHPAPGRNHRFPVYRFHQPTIRDAPIHQISDFRLIGDLNKIVPALTKILPKKIKQEEATIC